MIVADVTDYRWLVGAEAESFLAEATAAADPTTTLVRLRKRLTAARAALVVEQAELRRRGRAKFPAAETMFFTARGLEQATDATVAAFKARRFPFDAPVADLCCGVGGDLSALARRGPTHGIDADERVAIFAEANLRGVAADRRSSTSVTARRATNDDVAAAAAWHVDPDRRPSGRRTTRVELHDPDLATLESWLAVNDRAAIKLAPAAELPPAWSERAASEWISRGGECRQLVAWFGDLAARPGRRRASILQADGTARTVDEAPGAELAAATEIGRYVYEPDAAVLAADLVAELAAEHGLSTVHPGSAYLTGDEPRRDAALARFEVLETLPFDRKRLRGALAGRNVGRLEIKKRGLDVDVEQLRRELKLRGDREACLILARRGARVTAIVARRLP